VCATREDPVAFSKRESLARSTNVEMPTGAHVHRTRARVINMGSRIGNQFSYFAYTTASPRPVLSLPFRRLRPMPRRRRVSRRIPILVSELDREFESDSAK